MRGIFVQRERARGSGSRTERPEVVEAIARSRAHRVVPARYPDDRSVAEEHRALARVFAELVQALEPEAVGAIEGGGVPLFERRFAVAAVVFVRRERRPLTRGVEGLTDEQALRGNGAGNHVVHLAKP